jgi:hypothetical protein
MTASKTSSWRDDFTIKPLEEWSELLIQYTLLNFRNLSSQEHAYLFIS